MSHPLSSQTLPALSAIVVIPDEYKTVARTMEALKKQTAVSQIEIVFVVPAHGGVSISPDALDMFYNVQVTQVTNAAYSHALAQGICHANAPVVALTEDHSFPAPNWAERLIAAHAQGHTVVGPAMRLGNSSSPVSCADFYMGYGKWAVPVTLGEQDFLMAHNGSYKRAVLLEYGARLDEMMDAETVMQMELKQRGHSLWLEATTETTHFNYERWETWLHFVLYYGRTFAALRAQRWHAAKRALYVLASPLIPLVRFLRVRRDLKRAGFPWAFRLRVYFMVWLGLLMDGAGQALGYALGRGDTVGPRMDFEFHRERHFKTPAFPAE